MTEDRRQSFRRWKDSVLWVLLLAWASYVSTGAALAYSLKGDWAFIKDYIIKGVQKDQSK